MKGELDGRKAFQKKVMKALEVSVALVVVGATIGMFEKAYDQYIFDTVKTAQNLSTNQAVKLLLFRLIGLVKKSASLCVACAGVYSVYNRCRMYLLQRQLQGYDAIGKGIKA